MPKAISYTTPLIAKKSEVAAYIGFDIHLNLPHNRAWVASVHTHSLSIGAAKAYADLFTAAPDLLEALEKLLDALPDREGRSLSFHYKKPLRMADEAIKKARGEA